MKICSMPKKMDLMMAAIPKSRYGQTKTMKQMMYSTGDLEGKLSFRYDEEGRLCMSMGRKEGMSRDILEKVIKFLSNANKS